jgi:MEMO1 family protein
VRVQKGGELKLLAHVRPSPIAGQWYSDDPRRLAAQVDGYLAAARLPELAGEVVGVMAPHAGHRYSGPVAGYAFAALRGLQPEVVAVVSPMHYPYWQPLLTTAHGAYETPLGQIEVDKEGLEIVDQRLKDGLKEILGEGLARVSNDPEHSLEIELPFLQRVLVRGFRLLPIMVRDQSADVAKALGAALAAALAGRRCILVASTDLSHFYPRTLADTLDGELLRRVAAFDPVGVIQAEEEELGFACGCGALAAVLWAAQELGADQVQVVRHATSGDITGEYDSVVGYGAAVITRSTKI